MFNNIAVILKSRTLGWLSMQKSVTGCTLAYDLEGVIQNWQNEWTGGASLISFIFVVVPNEPKDAMTQENVPNHSLRIQKGHIMVS